jgi:Predicted metal-dependent phosphoesterases (PHP family)
MKLDLHVHSFFSDGRESPKVLVEYARKLDVIIALTDHDTSKGVKCVEGRVIPGQEVTTREGHVVILCDFPPDPPTQLESLTDYSRENSCVIFPSHPFDTFRKGIGRSVFEYKFDAVEIFNSKAPGWANKRALEASLKLNLPGLANSDAHVKEALGSAYNLIEINEVKPSMILEEIRKGRVKPFEVGLKANAKLKIIEWSIIRRLGLEKNTGGALR